MSLPHHLPTLFPAGKHGVPPGAESSIPAELSVYLTAPGKPGLAYLEDRGQVLSHFQCFSLHRVNHILHPGAGEAAGPAMGREGQPGKGPGVRKKPRCSRRASAPGRRHPKGRDKTGRDGTDWSRGRGGRRQSLGQGARCSPPRQWVADRA